MKTPDPAPLRKADEAISERAADFLERQRFAEWHDADQAEFESWLAESLLHRAAYLRLKGFVEYAGHLAQIHPFKAGASAGDGNGRFPGRHFGVLLLIAASLPLVAVAGVSLAAYLMQPPDRVYSTDVGGQTLLKFADGTQIELNTDTAIRYRMTTVKRTVWLQKGEAWFRVAHNPADPFTVIVGKHRVTDLGTEFLVRRGTDRMEVALLKGRASLSTEGAQTALLKPGEEAIATPVSLSVTRKTVRELADELAWRRGVWVFRSTRLADAVREVNRYSTTKLVIADPSIADLRFTGEIPNDSYEGFLRVAQSMMNLRTDREGNNILLFRAVQEKTKETAHVRRDR